ncbi:hypothetical protein ABIB85_007453 [Bradyrhizobium sp. JR1.5]
MISKFGDVPDDLGGRADCSAFQVEFGARPVCDRFDHLGPPRVPLSVRHDRDLPSILTGDDRDGDIRGQLADVFHLQLDRRVEFFARFCRFFQAGSFTARNGTTAFGYPRERMFLSSGPLSPWLSATGAVLKRRAVVHPSQRYCRVIVPSALRLRKRVSWAASTGKVRVAGTMSYAARHPTGEQPGRSSECREPSNAAWTTSWRTYVSV